MVCERNDLWENKVSPVAILNQSLRKHDLLLADHLDLTLVVTVHNFELLAENSTKSLWKYREYLELAPLYEPLPCSKHAFIGVFLSGDFCSSTNLIGVIPIVINVQILHVSFSRVYWNFTSDVVFLNIVDQKEITFIIVLFLENKCQKVDILIVLLVLEALKG